MQMETEINLEFFSESEQHLRQLEQQLKQVRDTDVGLLVPKDASAPALIAIGIKKGGDRMVAAAQRLAQVLYNFLHSEAGAAEQNQLLLLTIEGDRADIATLSVEEIERIILAAKEGQQG
jgi:hypothetical protein